MAEPGRLPLLLPPLGREPVYGLLKPPEPPREAVLLLERNPGEAVVRLLAPLHANACPDDNN